MNEQTNLPVGTTVGQSVVTFTRPPVGQMPGMTGGQLVNAQPAAATPAATYSPPQNGGQAPVGVGPGAPRPAPPEKPTDSFGRVIRPRDAQIQADPTPLPQFNNGLLVNTQAAQALVPGPVDSEEPQGELTDGEPASAETTTGPVKKKAPRPTDDKRLPPLVITILSLLAVLLVGVGVFVLWYRQNQEIQILRTAVIDRNDQIQQLRQEVVVLQDQNTLSSSPVYVDEDGYFSFYQNIPNLMVTPSPSKVELSYGEVAAGVPVAGFVMTIEDLNVGATGLASVVNRDYEHAPEGVEHADLRSEQFAEHFGYSYVARDSAAHETVYYYLQDAANSKRYVKISYSIAAPTENDYHQYEQVVQSIFNSLQLYE